MAEDSASEWQGYRKQDFTVDGRAAVLVFPVKPAPGNPWIWRTEFFGHEPQADLALLAKGFHVAFIDLQNMYGGPAAMGHMDKFFDELTSTHQLASKVVLEGFSRGGLFALNWAALHPEKISSIYLDAPVCDFKSWPAGFGKGPGSAGDWVQCKEAYGFASDDEAKAYRSNPVDRLEPLAKARIPLLIVYGEADEVVPVEENTEIVAARYRELGGEVELIGKPGGGHHPHSLQDPQRIVEFVLKNFAR